MRPGAVWSARFRPRKKAPPFGVRPLARSGLHPLTRLHRRLARGAGARILFATVEVVTKPLVTFIDTTGDTPRLAAGVSTEDYADACREAGLAFLVQAGARRMGKRELASWLVGPYRAVSAAMNATSGAAPGVATPVTESAVQELVDLVRIAVASGVGELGHNDTACITHAIREKLIVSSQDERGLVWIPTDRPRLRLEARVLSLFVVDYLLRTEHYERGDVSVCSDCDTVSFDGDRACGTCGDRAHTSEVRGTSRNPGLLAPLVAPVKIVG